MAKALRVKVARRVSTGMEGVQEVSKNMIIDGVEYVPLMTKSGSRAIVVVDRGWIFAGDVDESTPGRIRLTRAVWLFAWEDVGFAAVVEDPKNSRADIRPLTVAVDIPSDAEIFRLPVGDTWGL